MSVGLVRGGRGLEAVADFEEWQLWVEVLRLSLWVVEDWQRRSLCLEASWVVKALGSVWVPERAPWLLLIVVRVVSGLPAALLVL